MRFQRPRPPNLLGWHWRRWQLLAVASDPRGAVVDVLDLDAGGPEPLIATCRVATMEGAEVDLLPLLRAWVDRDDGLCDVFVDQPRATGPAALLQGEELLVVVMAPMR